MLANFENLQINENNILMDKTLLKDPSDMVSIKSRFGEINVDMSKAILFPKGLIGFPENLHFALAGFPTPRPELANFKFLQCLNDHSISLPVLPAGYENPFIDKADMEECINTVEVSKENFAMLFIVSSAKNSDGSFQLFINTKAPIIIDTTLQVALQFVFTNNKYAVKEELK